LPVADHPHLAGGRHLLSGLPGSFPQDDPLDEAQVEHDSAKVLILDLLHGSGRDPFRDAKFKVLREQILHHVREEEEPKGIFAQAQRCASEIPDLADRLHDRKAELEAMDRLPDPRRWRSPVSRGNVPAHPRRVKWQVTSKAASVMIAAALPTMTMTGGNRAARATAGAMKKDALPAVEAGVAGTTTATTGVMTQGRALPSSARATMTAVSHPAGTGTTTGAMAPARGAVTTTVVRWLVRRQPGSFGSVAPRLGEFGSRSQRLVWRQSGSFGGLASRLG
jgi:hypothetical protein